MSRSKIKVMLVKFFGWKGIAHHHFLPRGQMVNKQLYQEVLARLSDAVCRKRPELWKNQTWMLHHDNALAHASLLIRSYWQNIRHPLCSIHPILRTYPQQTLFSKLKTSLKGRRFQAIAEIQANAIRELRAITKSAFQEAFQQWKKRWERCIASRGDYFEGGSA